MFKVMVVAAAVVAVTGCTPKGAPTPSPTVGRAVQLAPECLKEGVALAPECNELNVLPFCATEDSGLDSPGQPCFWKDPDTGNLWYSNGIPGIQS